MKYVCMMYDVGCPPCTHLADLGGSLSSPALTFAHGHHEGMSSASQYQVWELETTDYARNLLCQPRLVAAGETVSHVHLLRELKAMREFHKQESERAALRYSTLAQEVPRMASACMQLAATAAQL